MANRYYTSNSMRKISGKSLPGPKAGSTMNMVEKPAFPSAKLPGKPSATKWGGDTKKCKIYPKSEGL